MTQGYCLIPVPVDELKTFLGQDFITNFQAEIDPIILPLRKHIALGRPASMGKEIWEYAVADSIDDAEWCGAGKGIADIRIGTDVAGDVKSVQIGKHATTEASMFQPLSEAEVAADYFKNKNDNGDEFRSGAIRLIRTNRLHGAVQLIYLRFSAISIVPLDQFRLINFFR